MEAVRKIQSSHVIPQFPTEAEIQTPAPAEATLVDISTEPAPPTTKTS